MNIVLFDDPAIRAALLPLTFTRPVGAVRCGILTIAEKWQQYSKLPVSYLTQPHLRAKYPQLEASNTFYVNGAVCPTPEVVAEILALGHEQMLYRNGMLVAARKTEMILEVQHLLSHEQAAVTESKQDSTVIRRPYDIFLHNGKELRADFRLLTAGRQSQPIADPHTIVYGAENIFLEEGATVKAAVLNAEDGPIYLGKNSQVQEGALIKGPFALCEGSHVNMGGKMRGDNTIGPFSKVGGEVSNSVIFGYSNKGHDGFIGNTVIGEWCNLGADTNTSNLKNNYAQVKLWDYPAGGFKNTGQQFCGLIMGDHAKCGINTMFNTGTVVGVGANVFGTGFPRNFIPDFSWGGAQGFETFQLKKMLEVADKVYQRRGKALDDTEQNLLTAVFEETKPLRIWDK
jgi:UDP-N-acetylglucosamine diphosphorylase/glucosamine-1-phosphate N-acetyltransferase